MAVLRARQPRGQMGTWCPRTRSPAQTGPGSRRGLLWGVLDNEALFLSRADERARVQAGKLLVWLPPKGLPQHLPSRFALRDQLAAFGRSGRLLQTF
jgi:hypothetical protein